MERRLYVANCGDDSVSVVCPRSMREFFRIPLLGCCSGIRRLAVDSGVLYHADAYSSTVGAIPVKAPYSAETQSVGTYPSDIAVAGGKVFVACGESNSLWKLSTFGLEAEACADTGAFPIAVAANGQTVYAAEMLSGTVSEYHADTLKKVCSTCLEGMPMAICLFEGKVICGALTATGGALYSLPSFRSRSLFAPVTKLCGGHGIYVAAHAWDDALTFFFPDTLEIHKVARTDKMPDDVVYDPRENRFFVSCMLSDTVLSFAVSGELTGRATVGREPRGLATSAF